MPPRINAANRFCEPPSCSKVTSFVVLRPASSSMTRRISDDFPPSLLMPIFFPFNWDRSSIFSLVATVYETRLSQLPSETTGTPCKLDCTKQVGAQDVASMSTEIRDRYVVG